MYSGKEYASLTEIWSILFGFWLNNNIIKYIFYFRENPLLRKFLFLIFFSTFGIGPSREGAKVILLRKGFSKEALATANLIITPIIFAFIAFGSYIGKLKKEFTCYIM